MSSLVNSHYYFYIVILFLCYVFPFGSKNFVFPLLSCIILDFELERIFKKSFKDFSKHIVSDGQMELILKHKCTFIWCSYYFKNNTILCYSSISLVKKRNFLSKRKKKLSQAVWFFFTFYAGLTYILRGSLFIKVASQWIWATGNLLQYYLIFNLS